MQIICKNCKNEFDARNIRRKYCCKKCAWDYRYSIPSVKKKLKEAAYKKYSRLKNDVDYKKMKYEVYKKWFAKPENKLKIKLYYREYQRRKQKIKPENYKV